MTDPTLTAEEQAAKDRAFLAEPRSTVQITAKKMPIEKLLKKPIRYLRELAPRTMLIGVNTLGAPILVLSRDGDTLSARGHAWAMERIRAKLPPVPTEPPPNADPE